MMLLFATVSTSAFAGLAVCRAAQADDGVCQSFESGPLLRRGEGKNVVGDYVIRKGTDSNLKRFGAGIRFGFDMTYLVYSREAAGSLWVLQVLRMLTNVEVCC